MTEDDHTITKDDIGFLLERVQADREARQVFLAMPREDQLLSILGMISYINSQLAKIQKENIDYRKIREDREGDHNSRLVDTGEKIAIGIQKALNERNQRSNRILDSVLTTIINVITLGILYLVFSHGANP